MDQRTASYKVACPQLKRCNSRKSVRWSAVPVPCLSRLWLKLRGEQGSGPKGVDDLCFHTYGEFSPSPSPPPHPPSPQPPGPYLSLEAHIPASRPKSQPRGPNSSLKGFGAKDWDLDLEAGVWASRLRYWPGGWGEGGCGGGEEGGEGGENSPYV